MRILRVADGLAVRSGHAEPLLGAKGGFVEVDRPGGALDRQVRGEGVKAVGNGFSLYAHKYSYCFLTLSREKFAPKAAFGKRRFASRQASVTAGVPTTDGHG